MVKRDGPRTETPAMGEPSVQASYMKQFAAQVRTLGVVADDVIAADPELFQAIGAAGRMTWMPIEINLRMVDALYTVLGVERARRFQADQISRQFDTPLWRTFVEGGVRLLGLDPGALVRWLPRALALMFRDCGIWTVERDDETSAAMIGRHLPEVLVAHPHWLDSVAGGIHALFVLCNTSGETRVRECEPALGQARITIGWKPGAG